MFAIYLIFILCSFSIESNITKLILNQVIQLLSSELLTFRDIFQTLLISIFSPVSLNSNIMLSTKESNAFKTPQLDCQYK